MSCGRKEFQQKLMDHLRSLEGQITIVLECLEKVKKLEGSHKIISKIIYQMKKSLNMLCKARILLLWEESIVKCVASLKALRTTLQQFSQCYTNDALTVYLATLGVNIVTLLTKQEKTSVSAKVNVFKGQSTREIINQCLSFDYACASITEIIQAFPLQLNLVTSPKPKRRVQDHEPHHATVPSRATQDFTTTEIQSSSEVNAALSSNNGLSPSSTQSNVSQYNGGQSLLTAATLSQAPLLPHESPESLLTEAISQFSDVSSDEETLPEDLLPSTQQLADSHQVCTPEEDIDAPIEVSSIEGHGQLSSEETMLPQPHGLTPTEFEVKGSINDIRGQKLFYTELGVSVAEQHVYSSSDDLLSQLPISAGHDTETKFTSTLTVPEEKLVVVSTQNAHS